MPTRNVNRLLWLVMLGVLGLLVLNFDVSVYLGKGKLTVQRDPGNDRVVILRWLGEVRHPMNDKLAEAYRENRSGTERFVLVLSSPGGSVSHGGAVIRTLREMRRSHQLETVIEGNGTCASMCVPVYLQGEERRAAARSRWMFHEVSVHDIVTDEKQSISPAERTARTDKLFDDYFRPAGVDARWIAEIRTLMRKGDVWRSGEQLVRTKSGIILDLM